MWIKKYFFFIYVLSFLFIPIAKSEDIVILKTGEEIAGEIVSKTSTELKIAIQIGSIKTYEVYKKEDVKKIIRGEKKAEEKADPNDLEDMLDELIIQNKAAEARMLFTKIQKQYIRQSAEKYGDLICHICKGSTFSSCSSCSGKGRIKSQQTTSVSQGSKTTCPVCHGVGRKKKPFKTTIKKDLTTGKTLARRNSKNSGSGRAAKLDDHGSSITEETIYIPCSRCNGTGTVHRSATHKKIRKTKKCPQCIFGKIKCAYCSGTGGHVKKIAAKQIANEKAKQEQSLEEQAKMNAEKLEIEKVEKAKQKQEAEKRAKEYAIKLEIKRAQKAEKKAKQKEKRDLKKKEREKVALKKKELAEKLAEKVKEKKLALEKEKKSHAKKIKKGYGNAIKAGARLYLKSAYLKPGRNQVKFEGVVQNVSNKTIRTIEAVVTWRTKSGEEIATTSNLIKVQVLIAHAKSRFTVTLPYTPGTYYATVKFNNSVIFNTEIDTFRLEEKAYFKDKSILE